MTDTETLILRRTFDAPPERVFRAWTDPVERARWDCPQEGWTTRVLEMDVRVGGTYRVAFGPPGEEPYLESGEYREVTRPTRLVFAYSVSRHGTVLQRTVCTIELTDLGGRTEVVITDAGMGAESHRGGWTHALDRLAAVLLGPQ